MSATPQDIERPAPVIREGELSAANLQEDLVMHLERDQFVAETSKPVARVVLGRRASAGLRALRIFVIVVSTMVIYTFVAQLH